MLNFAAPTQAAKASPKELDLITAAQRGDISAFNQLVRAHQELAYRFVFHLLDDARAAETLTQRVFENAYAQIRRWNGDAFRIWILRMALQQCQRAPHRQIQNSLAQHAPLEMGMASLSFQERVICVLGDVLGVSEHEIARITNLSINVVRATRRRARLQLRAVLQINGLALNSTERISEN